MAGSLFRRRCQTGVQSLVGVSGAQGGLRPHVWCLPVLKREHHRQAVAEAATSGDARFFLGTDSAPHLRGAKVSPPRPPHPSLRCDASAVVEFSPCCWLILLGLEHWRLPSLLAFPAATGSGHAALCIHKPTESQFLRPHAVASCTCLVFISGCNLHLRDITHHK